MNQTRTTAEALGQLDAVLSSIEHTHREDISHEERVVLMNRARRVAERVAALAAVLTAEVDRHQSTMHVAKTPLTSFLSTLEHRDSREASTHVFTARDITAHPSVQRAALSGSITTRHARAIATAMGHLPLELTAEQRNHAAALFLHHAHTSTPKQVTKKTDDVLTQVAPELVPSPDDHAARLKQQHHRAHQKRFFAYGDDGEGSTWFTGSLPHVDAAPLIQLVEARVTTERAAARNHAMGIRSLKPGLHVLREHGTVKSLTAGQRRADALVGIIADHRVPTAPTSPPPPPRVVVTMTEASLRLRTEQAGVLDNGTQISPAELRLLACSAELVPTVLGTRSEVLDVGHTHRLVTPGLRKQLSLRDQGCVFPHCEAADAQCHAHHVVPWWDTGPTSLGNLVLLCPHHHALIEPQRFNPTADQWLIGFHPTTRKPVVHPPRKYKLFLHKQRIPKPGQSGSPDPSITEAA